jgi:hypothetical protein
VTLLALTLAALAGPTVVLSADDFVFAAVLHGAQEVSPPAPEGGVDTETSGRLQLRFDHKLSQALFRVDVRDAEDVTAAHLHCGSAGVNGPVAVLLFESDDAEDVDGLLARGTLTNADVTPVTCAGVDAVEVNNIASLAFAAKAGLIYVNVHTEENEGGEVRGQLVADDGHGNGHGDDEDDEEEDEESDARNHPAGGLFRY